LPTAPAYETAIFVEEDSECFMLTDSSSEEESTRSAQSLCGVDDASPMERADDEDTRGPIGDFLCRELMDYDAAQPAILHPQPRWPTGYVRTLSSFVDELPELPTDAQFEALYRQYIDEST